MLSLCLTLFFLEWKHCCNQRLILSFWQSTFKVRTIYRLINFSAWIYLYFTEVVQAMFFVSERDGRNYGQGFMGPPGPPGAKGMLSQRL